MTNISSDTIAAIATPIGRGGVGIVRVSGPLCELIAEAILHQTIKSRTVHVGAFYDEVGESLDQGIALFFKAPHSFTGEDVLELQAHGSPVVLNLLLAQILSLGARLAEPGEFTKRAFLNDKMDLAQAEAVADLIDASSEKAARSAMHALEGDFSALIHALVDQLTQLRVYIEATINFPEEEIEFLQQGEVAFKLNNILAKLNDVLHTAEQGVLLREGVSIAIVGKPNVGKSSLLNVLSGQETAIVTHIPGTTRDVLRELIHLDGMPLHIIDTAGLRPSEDIIEQEGMRRTLKEIEKADQILWVTDSDLPETLDIEAMFDETIRKKIQDKKAITILRNKIDLIEIAPHIEEKNGFTVIYLSAKTREGIDLLKTHLKEVAGFQSQAEGVFIARLRHLDALNRAKEFLLRAQAILKESSAIELLAEELRQAQLALCVITGEVTTEDLLDRIFSQFCIGK